MVRRADFGQGALRRRHYPRAPLRARASVRDSTAEPVRRLHEEHVVRPIGEQRTARRGGSRGRRYTSPPERCCVHTKNIVEPGRYSHRSTAVPRSERLVKFGSPKLNGAAGPAPSGSTVYVRPSRILRDRADIASVVQLRVRARRRELAEALVVAARQERLRVELHRHLRRDRPVHARLERQRARGDVAEDVSRATERAWPSDPSPSSTYCARPATSSSSVRAARRRCRPA